MKIWGLFAPYLDGVWLYPSVPILICWEWLIHQSRGLFHILPRVPTPSRDLETPPRSDRQLLPYQLYGSTTYSSIKFTPSLAKVQLHQQHARTLAI